MWFLLAPFAALLVSVALPAVLDAQVFLGGRVVEEETAAQIAGAQVVLLDGDSRRVAVQTTDEEGRFSFLVRRAGPHRIRVSRIGYQTVTSPHLWLGEHRFMEVEMRLHVSAVLIAPLEVTALAPRRSPTLDDFRARMRTGLGTFLTREDIESQRPAMITDLLATVVGVHLVSSGNRSSGRQVYMSRAMSGTRDCPAQVFVDGFLLNRASLSGERFGFTIDDAVHPSSVEGIEIYRGVSGVPAQFMNPEAHCGVVAIWTRRGNG